MKLTIRCLLAASALLALGACETSQPLALNAKLEGCVTGSSPAGSVSYCEQRSYPDLATGGSAKIRATNGFVYAGGDSRSTIALNAVIYTQAATEARAKEIASQVVINTGSDDFYATGPVVASPESWSVSFDVMLPVQMNFDAQTTNGALRLTGFGGHISADATNGDLQLNSLAGAVDAHTTNGRIDIQLAGTAWTGSGLRADANNGTLVFSAPKNYSARVTLDAQNGSTASDFPGGATTQPSPTDSHYEVTLGSGGVLLTGTAHNGNAELREQNPY